MKIVSISQDFFDLVEGDRELMLKHDRPCIVVVRLRFRGKRRDFAVPLRYQRHSAAAPLRRALSNSFGFGGSNCSLILGVQA